MLNQAIVDAQALREAAIKNAETSVIEKYSDQIREAIETILEQPFEEPIPGMEGEEEEEEAGLGTDQELLDQAPLAALDGENLCPCPEEEEEIVLNLDIDALEDQVAQAGIPEEELGRPSQEDLAGAMGAEMPEEEEEETLFEELSQLNLTETILEEILSEEEAVNVKENILKDIIESLTVDIKPGLPTGWQGTDDSMNKDAAAEHAAKEKDTSEENEESKELRKAIDKMEENQKSLRKILKQKESNIKTLKSVVYTLKDKINESNTLNAKLVYTNKILTNGSLNERQKDKIVEALSKSNSVEETKTIFETLQNAVGTSSKKPYESLSEAVNRNSSTMLSSAKKRKPMKENLKVSGRWKTLAGIE